MRHRYKGLFVAAVLVAISPKVHAQPWPLGIDSALGLEGGRLGLQVQPMTEELREHFHAPPDRGVLVSYVTPGKPAAEGGVQVADIILSAGGTPVQQPFDLLRAVSRAPEGEDFYLIVVRDGTEQSLVVKPEGQAMPWIDPSYWQEWAQRGLRMGNDELRHQLEELDRRLRDLERQFEDLKKDSQTKNGQRT